MSASDAVPLPRLGEVYFDVRGESRSMRLSWYADTGVAVFSIWQGSTCTGTFRLPIADLPRMVQALQRGPDWDSGSSGEQPAGQARRDSPARDLEPAPPGEYGQEPTGRYSDSGRTGAYADELSAGPSTAGRSDGYRDEIDARYSGRRSSGWHRDDLAGDYGQKPGTGSTGGGRRSGYPDEPGTGYAGGESSNGYADEPTGIYHDPDLRYPSSGHNGGYEQNPTGPYSADSVPAGYRDDSLPGSSPAYHDDGLPGQYEQAGRHPEDRHPGRYEPERTATYSAGGYADEPTGVYRGDTLHQGYEDERGGRYPAGEYPGDPLPADYPTGPPGLDYPSADDPRDYPPASRDPGFTPARPYVPRRSREAGGPEAGTAHEPRRTRSRRDDNEPAPGSFPYGQPPSEHPAGGETR
jgi:hypothetical protein